MMSIEKLQELAARARDLEFEITDREEQIRNLKAELNDLYDEQMPTLLDDLGLDNIGIAPNGNQPGYDFELRPYYAANIAANWTEEKRELAFSLLSKLGAEDLIKSEISTRLPKGSIKLAKQILAAIKKLGVDATHKKSVHNQTLSAWLRELYETRHQSLSNEQLEKIGGHVGRKVVPKERGQ